MKLATLRDEEMVSNSRRWPNSFLCLKQRGDGPLGYAQFGVIDNDKEPVTIYAHNHITVLEKYHTFADMFADGWLVD